MEPLLVLLLCTSLVYAERFLHSTLRPNGLIVFGSQADLYSDMSAISIQLVSVLERDRKGTSVGGHNYFAGAPGVLHSTTNEESFYEGIPVLREDHRLCLRPSGFSCKGTVIQTTVFTFKANGTIIVNSPVESFTYNSSLLDPRNNNSLILGCNGTSDSECVRAPLDLSEGVEFNGALISYISDTPSNHAGLSLFYNKTQAMEEQFLGYQVDLECGDVVEISTYIKFVGNLPELNSSFGFANSVSLDHDSQFLSQINQSDVWYLIESKFRATSNDTANVYLDLTGLPLDSTVYFYDLSVRVYRDLMPVEEGTVKFNVLISNWTWRGSSNGSFLDLIFTVQSLSKDDREGLERLAEYKSASATNLTLDSGYCSFSKDTMHYGPYNLWFPSYYSRDEGTSQEMTYGYPYVAFEKSSASKNGQRTSKNHPGRFTVTIRLESDNNNQLLYDPVVSYNVHYQHAPATAPASSGPTYPIFPILVVSLGLLSITISGCLFLAYRQRQERKERSKAGSYASLTNGGYNYASSSPRKLQGIF